MIFLELLLFYSMQKDIQFKSLILRANVRFKGLQKPKVDYKITTNAFPVNA